MGQAKVICLEFNELSPVLMDKFIEQGRLPNFQKLRDQSFRYITDAEAVAPNLEPWIQWVTVHSGLSWQEHGILVLGDGHKKDFPRVWDLVAEQGHKVWICGSMNASFRRPITGFILPDPWSVGVVPYPDGEFDAYVNFVRTYVQEHTREKAPVTKSDQLRFLQFMTTHGMGQATIASILKQLMSERGGRNRWKRAVILDRLQWDIFAYYWNRHQPKYSTFFINSTAHFQHVYWRNMEPDLFASRPDAEEQAEYENAILYGYEKMDEIVGRCLALADADTTVVFATALSQQPCLKYEERGGKTFYRPVEPEAFLRFAGITNHREFAPVMSEEFRLYFASPAEAEEGVRKLRAVTYQGKPAFLAQAEGSDVIAGCCVMEEVPAHAALTNHAGEQAAFAQQLYHAKVVKSGMHHPDGIFWIGTPEGRRSAGRVAGAPERISLRRVAPTLLELMGMKPLDYMAEGLLTPEKLTAR